MCVTGAAASGGTKLEYRGAAFFRDTHPNFWKAGKTKKSPIMVMPQLLPKKYFELRYYVHEYRKMLLPLARLAAPNHNQWRLSNLVI